MSKGKMVADFYVGRGETAEYLGSVWGDGTTTGVTPEELRAFTRWQGTEHHLYEERDYRADVAHLIESADHVGDRSNGPEKWPHRYGTSGASDWAYCFDKASVHIFEEGHLVATILCNGARKEAEFPWHGGVPTTADQEGSPS